MTSETRQRLGVAYPFDPDRYAVPPHKMLGQIFEDMVRRYLEMGGDLATLRLHIADDDLGYPLNPRLVLRLEGFSK